MNEEFREKLWRCADGRRIKIKDLSPSHIVNIMNWVTARSESYPPAVIEMLKEEASYRQITQFAAGQPYPLFDGTMWILVNGEMEDFTNYPPEVLHD